MHGNDAFAWNVKRFVLLNGHHGTSAVCANGMCIVRDVKRSLSYWEWWFVPETHNPARYDLPHMYYITASKWSIRGLTKRAEPEMVTIFGRQIQATKSEAPLWGLTFLGSDSDTENGNAKWAKITMNYNTLLQTLICNHTHTTIQSSIYQLMYATFPWCSHGTQALSISNTLYGIDLDRAAWSLVCNIH